MTCRICHRSACTESFHSIATQLEWEKQQECAPEADHDRDWYAEHDPQSLVDSINAANAGNPRKP